MSVGRARVDTNSEEARLKTFLNALGALLLLGVAAAIVVVGAILFGRWFFALPSETVTATSALVGVILVPVITYFTQRNLERRRSREEAVQEKKTQFYDETINDLMRLFNIDKSKSPITQDEIVAMFAKVPGPLLTFGARGVIVAWNNLRAEAVLGDTLRTATAMEGLFKAMRKDLGHPVWMHQRFELIGVFVNDAKDLGSTPAVEPVTTPPQEQ
jgi:hypothetical protein